MDDKTCDVCGKVCAKHSAMLAHKRWAHGAGSPVAAQRAELAEYKTLDAKVVALAGQVQELAREMAKRPALAAPGAARGGGSAQVAETKGESGGGWGWGLALLAAMALVSQTTEGRAWVAGGGESPVQALMGGKT